MTTPALDRSRTTLMVIALATPLACTPDDPGVFTQGLSAANDESSGGPDTGGNLECGDGYVDPGEECDLGPDNSDAGQCTTSCEIASCGDGHLYEGFEDCDDGNADNTDACTSMCKPAVCGDGYTQQGVEACDDGDDDETDGCTSYCLPTYCGDGIVQDGEQCDDGNMITTDECPACQFSYCGDGFLLIGVEACDDGNTEPGDECTAPFCQYAECGDGIVWEGVETCDDANDDRTDDCPKCEPAYCGDGYVQAGVEECDDANMVDDDFCQNTCISNGMYDDFETNDFTVLPWVTNGNAEWLTTTNMPHEGMYVAENGDIADSQQSHLEVPVLAPSNGIVRFWYRVSSENNYDYLRFYIDNVELQRWAGNVNWTMAEFDVPMGMHTLRWSYTKDGSVSSGSDSVWIDEVYIGGP